MSNPLSQLLARSFDDSDLLCILEAARIGLSDGEYFDTIAEDMDLCDQVLVSLRERLHEFLNQPLLP